MPRSDVAVIGGGIVGLATAMEWLARFPGSKVLVLEKEPALGTHQTGHNSGVIHSGIYYRPGSLKARTCVEGARRLIAFCAQHRIPHRLSGKLIIATRASELPRLEALYQRGLANGVPGLARLDASRLREIEPHAQGLGAIHVPGAGVVDYRAVAQAFAQVCARAGAQIVTSARVQRLRRQEGDWQIETTAGAWRSRYVITCGGLQADRLARMAGAPPDLIIVPFRGDYYEVVPHRRELVQSMIYPVPDPELPFLGVHATRGIDEQVHIGPNAVLALKREGYRKAACDPRDLWEMLQAPGFWRMARRHWAVGWTEIAHAVSKSAFVRAIQRLVPALTGGDLVPGGSGVRAQAVDRCGALADDFDIVQGRNALWVRNVPSPAATACLSISRIIVDHAAA